mmetsp:Transcript_11907/g.31901  ORF Transcript_11907/g.31901 Transcript_11907/m.31901 type:complete len:80 (+) Transcript_11907:25-264(+)
MFCSHSPELYLWNEHSEMLIFKHARVYGKAVHCFMEHGRSDASKRACKTCSPCALIFDGVVVSFALNVLLTQSRAVFVE